MFDPRHLATLISDVVGAVVEAEVDVEVEAPEHAARVKAERTVAHRRARTPVVCLLSATLRDVSNAKSILDAATAIAAQARVAAEEIEVTQRLPAELVQAMSAAGLFQMYVRPSVGGPAHHPLTAYRAVETLARADASVAWLSMVATGCSWLTGWVADDALRVMCGDPCDFRLAGSERPLGRATRVEGGYRLSGRWNFASGIMHANWVMAGCFIDDAAAEPTMRILLLPVGDVRVEHTWSVVGMRGTGSHDFIVDDVFVPEARAVLAIGQALSDEAIYSQRLLRVCTFGPVAAVLVGAALGAIDDVLAIAGQPTIRNSTALRDRPELQRCIADSTARIDSARAYISEVITAAYDAVCNEQDPTIAVATSRLAFAHAAQQAIFVIGELIRVVGTPAAHLSNPLQRRARDVMVAQHFPSFDISTYETAGRVLLGLEANDGGW
jgi:alkylation response protein AidB-like acyl-CoA dehydrogenase